MKTHFHHHHQVKTNSTGQMYHYYCSMFSLKTLHFDELVPGTTTTTAIDHKSRIYTYNREILTSKTSTRFCFWANQNNNNNKKFGPSKNGVIHRRKYKL